MQGASEERIRCDSRTDLSMLVARALKIGKIADGGTSYL
jgi:hypothetical protein